MSYSFKRVFSFSFFCFSLLLLLISLSLFFYQQAYAGKIYRNVYFEDIDLSGKTKKEATILIKDKYDQLLDKYLIIKSGPDEVKVRIKDTGIYLNIVDIVNSSYQIGRSQNFFKEILDSTKTMVVSSTIDISFGFKEENYQSFIKIAVEQLNRPAVDATIKIENGQIITTDGASGNIVITDNLNDRIVEVINQETPVLQLIKTDVPPNLTIDNFNDIKNKAETYLSKRIVFSYNAKNYTPARSDIGNWLVIENNEDNFNISLDENNVRAYLNKIAPDFEIKRVDKKINGKDDAIIEEGKAGIYLDRNKAITDLKNQIGNTNITVALQTYNEDPKELVINSDEGAVAGRFEGKYIDVNLATQRLCTFEGQENKGCYTISSGKPSMPTPTGTFHIQNKNERQWSSKYGLWMPYWEAFSGDYGLHELPEWPGGYKEGQDHLGHPVSHGCVRLGIGDAKTIFDWTEIGTPVYIHK